MGEEIVDLHEQLQGLQEAAVVDGAVHCPLCMQGLDWGAASCTGSVSGDSDSDHG